MTDDTDYEALASRLTSAKTPVEPAGAPLIGAAAAAAGRAFLLREFGTDDAIDSAIRAGRPRLGKSNSQGGSPLVKGRISEADFAAFKLLESQTGMKQSELVREAVRLLLERNNLTKE